MNSQIVSIKDALKGYTTFYFVTTLIAISLFFPAGFISVAVIWFFALCLYNYALTGEADARRFTLLVWPIALYVINLPWIFFSSDATVTGELISRKVHLLLIPLGFTIVNKRTSDRAFNVILSFFFLGCMLASLFCLAGAMIRFVDDTAIDGHALDAFTSVRLTEIVGTSPAYMSMFMTMAFLITLQSPFFGRATKFTISIYLAIFIMLIGSLAGILGIGLVLLIFLQDESYKLWVRISISFALILMIAVIVIQQASRHISPFKASDSGEVVTSVRDRLTIWSYAFETAMEKPLVGYGPGIGQKALEETYKKETFAWGAAESLNPHNQFLSTYLDLGIPGLIALVLLLIYPLFFSLRTHDSFLASFMVITFLFFCVESVLVRQKGIVFFAFFYSLISSNRLISPAPEIKEIQSTPEGKPYQA